MLLEAGGLDAELYRLGHTKVCTPIQPTPECDDFCVDSLYATTTLVDACESND
jgi:hypothetical protein